MGTEIKKKGDLYQLKSTVSGELKHEEDWITEDDAKKSLITTILWNAIEKIVCVEMDFPAGYRINDKFVNNTCTGLQFIIDSSKNEFVDGVDPLHVKFLEILKKHNLENFFICQK